MENKPESNFDFQEGMNWFSRKYLHILFERIVLLVFALFMLLILLFALWKIYNFLPTHRQFLVIKDNENPLDDHIVVSRLTSTATNEDVDVLIAKYLVKYYVECREGYDKSYRMLKTNSCNLFLKNYSTVLEYKKFSNYLISEALQQEKMKYGEDFRKSVEINDIILYNKNIVGGKVSEDFMVDCRMRYFMGNKLVDSVNSRLKINISLSGLYLISKGVVPFDFSVLGYEKVLK